MRWKWNLSDVHASAEVGLAGTAPMKTAFKGSRPPCHIQYFSVELQCWNRPTFNCYCFNANCHNDKWRCHTLGWNWNWFNLNWNCFYLNYNHCAINWYNLSWNTWFGHLCDFHPHFVSGFCSLTFGWTPALIAASLQSFVMIPIDVFAFPRRSPASVTVPITIGLIPRIRNRTRAPPGGCLRSHVVCLGNQYTWITCLDVRDWFPCGYEVFGMVQLVHKTANSHQDQCASKNQITLALRGSDKLHTSSWHPFVKC